ncbi:NAD-glutamate dehydrogenase [Fodinicurvata sp. EGI_FJ10296]|uniref:NAD-glutamate dehydrogenase n=1 Tax=Fodinicurvata sp. EGI_FJ10296 TaxID=3231908 RepID=UPI003455DEA7
MPTTGDKKKAELIDEVVAIAHTRLGPDKTELAEAFIRAYYRHVPPDDILVERADDLYGAALGLMQFGARRGPEPSIRVFNPTYDASGWHTSHTVVEVINDDMPFLVDSVTSALNALALTVHIVVHPILAVQRDDKGRLTAVRDVTRASKGGMVDRAKADAGDEGLGLESFMHVEVDEQTSPETLERIEQEVARTLKEVRSAVDDWQSMRDKIQEVIADLGSATVPGGSQDRGEISDFLKWLDNHHFTFLGYRHYAFNADKRGRTELSPVADSGLGVLSDPDVSIFDGMRKFSALPPDVQSFMRQPHLLMVTKANRQSFVHRATAMDTIIVKAFDKNGNVAGEHIFVGLFTSVAYSRSASDIPFLRRKVERCLATAGFDPQSHDGKALTHILDTFPRDELFQIGDDDLLDMALGILHLQERQRTALFVRRDPYERFVSCLVFAPRDRYNTDLRRRFEAILESAFDGKIQSFVPQFGEAAHARVHFVISTQPGKIPAVDVKEIEDRLVQATRYWADHLRDSLIEARGEERGLLLLRQYGEAFPTSYREAVPPQAAINDIDRIEEVIRTGRIGLNLYREIESDDHQVRFKLYHAGQPVPLSDVLPMLEHMGLKVIAENPYDVRVRGHDHETSRVLVWIHDFATETQDGSAIDVKTLKEKFQSAFARIWEGGMEDDGFNRLVLLAGMGWREVVVLRAYGRFLRQARITFSQDSLENTLAAHPDISRKIVDLFRVRFDVDGPDGADREAVEESVLDVLNTQLNEVSNLDEDLILRRFINCVRATLRTNFHQTDDNGEPKPYLSLKLDSAMLDDLPKPRPWREIFVYSPRVEGVHLRGGKVARGGIRWSDRREDFRTEILGLMKAQVVKNAVIVPVGSKGGFVVKRPPREGGREAMQAEGIECYKTLMRGMLDITDNIVRDSVVHPERTVRHDEDDPYLVVAADKGTATFSDIANGVSQSYGFWLDDAFASGGSAGYDHKKMGITARGAWESVKRHFRELGLDTQSQTFTAIGVGDMSGDVFGNGMLLSEGIRLQAAFNHLHIFIDPDPDPAVTFKERKRLFELGRGSWDQYDKALISKGGGVFDRKAKSITLTPQIKTLTGLTQASVTPNTLISALLRAPVDLLWFGGIGTYIKASSESHADVGDKANDALRIDGRDIRARVVGEGANLGVTQRGRIEFARAGGRVNTDFIDNSAGVDCSDHEVNIKVLLNDVVSEGDMTLKQRNALLGSMTDDVAQLVLRDNYLQTQALSLVMSEASEHLDQQTRFMKGLEKAGRLDRAIEALPDDEDLADLAAHRAGLSRPEMSILLSYSKITLYDDILASTLPDDPSLTADLRSYFPDALARYSDAIDRHKLHREIIATIVTNVIINRTTPTFVMDMVEKTGMGPADVARAYLMTERSFALPAIWASIEALDNKVPAETQIRMMSMTIRLVDRMTAWFLRNCGDRLDIADLADRYRQGIETLTGSLDSVLYPAARQVIEARSDGLIEAGVPRELALRVSSLNLMAAATDLIRITDDFSLSLSDAAPLYFALGDRLGLAWLRDAATNSKSTDHWHKQAVAAIVDDLYALQADLTIRVIGALRQDGPGGCAIGDAHDALERWISGRPDAVDRVDQLVTELKAMDHLDLSMLAVANRRLRGMMVL